MTKVIFAIVIVAILASTTVYLFHNHIEDAIGKKSTLAKKIRSDPVKAALIVLCIILIGIIGYLISPELIIIKKEKNNNKKK